MFEYDKNIPDPERGDLLISEPFLNDPNFERTVILICEHNDQGTFGLVMNKLTDLLLSDVMKEEIDFTGLLNLGGPVEQNTLHFIHRRVQGIEGSIALGEDLFWSGDFEQVKFMLNEGLLKEENIQFYLGYSGWGEGQLRDELDRQSWFIKKQATAHEIFDMEPDELWKSVLKGMGGKYKVFSNYPVDPRLN
ncbi:YqgE/AlgH family protein [Roseivirga pacifica]